MSNPIGDTIDLLSTTTPLTAGSTWTSSGVVLGTYNSLVVMVKTDIDSTLYVDWSGDNGLNWDASDQHAIVDTVTKRIVITTQQKMIRLRLINGAVNQTYLRLFTYGVVTNNSSLVSLVSSIDISNLISGLTGRQTQVTQLTPITQYNFGVGQINAGTCNNNPSLTIYSDLNANCGAITSPTVGLAGADTLMGGYLFLEPSVTDTAVGTVYGRSHSLRAGETLIGRFVSSFNVSDSTGGSLLVGLIPPQDNTRGSASLSTYYGMAFGWFVSAPKTNDNFGIVFGNSVFVNRLNFNGDKCDGNSTLPELDFTNPAKPNMFQVEISSGGNLRFSIMNPSDNKFVLVHQVTNLHTQLSNPVPELCFSMIAVQGSGYTSGTDQANVLCATILTDMPVAFPTSACRAISYDVAVGGSIIFPVFLRNSPAFALTNINYGVNLAFVSISTSGTNPVTVTFIRSNASSGGSWSAVGSGLYRGSLPVEQNTTGTFALGGGFNTEAVQQFELGANDSLYQTFDSLTPFLYGQIPIVISVSSKGTSDVRICLGLSA